eukprot:1161565-Pelagomonas_calceolata.AAC.11
MLALQNASALPYQQKRLNATTALPPRVAPTYVQPLRRSAAYNTGMVHAQGMRTCGALDSLYKYARVFEELGRE